MDVALSLSAAFFGLAGGLAVGSGLVAFLVVLDVIPRVVQLTRSYGEIRKYEGAVVAGAVFWTFTDFFDWKLHFASAWIALPVTLAGTAVIGLFAGIFVGMVAAALTEVLNVLPILAKRLNMTDAIVWLLMAMVFGKVMGSLFDWLIYQS